MAIGNLAGYDVLSSFIGKNSLPATKVLSKLTKDVKKQDSTSLSQYLKREHTTHTTVTYNSGSPFQNILVLSTSLELNDKLNMPNMELQDTNKIFWIIGLF